MELEDFRSKDSKLKTAPVAVTDGSGRIDDLIAVFRSYQEKQKKRSILFAVINIVLAVLYLSAMPRMNGTASSGYLLLVAGFILGALYLRLRYRALPHDNYSLPLSEFLLRAERSISYFNNSDYLIVMPLLAIIGTGGGIVLTTSLLKYTDNAVLLIIIWIIFFISLVIFGFVAGRKSWEKEYGEFYRKIKEARLNLNSQEGKD